MNFDGYNLGKPFGEDAADWSADTVFWQGESGLAKKVKDLEQNPEGE